VPGSLATFAGCGWPRRSQRGTGDGVRGQQGSSCLAVFNTPDFDPKSPGILRLQRVVGVPLRFPEKSPGKGLGLSTPRSEIGRSYTIVLLYPYSSRPPARFFLGLADPAAGFGLGALDLY
jgi:hypothetical protein